MLTSAVTTCKRPSGVQYLFGTVDSLVSAGLGYPFRYEDGATLGLPRSGIVPTFRIALWTATQASTTPYVAVFQDDIRVRSNLREYLEETVRGNGVYALYLSPQRTAPPGWSQLPDDGTYPLHIGGCGFLMDTATALRLLESPPFARTDRLGSQLALWCRRHGIPFWLHSPSLIEHVGEVSCREAIQDFGRAAQLASAASRSGNRQESPAVPGD